MGVPLVIIHIHIGFSLINHPLWGQPIAGKLQRTQIFSRCRGLGGVLALRLAGLQSQGPCGLHPVAQGEFESAEGFGDGETSVFGWGLSWGYPKLAG